jgi:HSP20 family protein
MYEDMDRTFQRFFGGMGLSLLDEECGVFTPRVDVSESDNEVKVVAELPGLDEKDIDVSLSDDMLTIKGEKKHEKEQRGRDYYRMERSWGSFSRSVALPCEVVGDKVEGVFDKGVLTISLPKSKEAAAKCGKIKVSAE